MTTVRARYEVLPIAFSNIVAIIDFNDGRHMSVTNDAENVVNKLRTDGIIKKGDRLIYRDSDGIWDELVLTEQLTFAGFKAIRKQCVTLAAYAAGGVPFSMGQVPA